MKRKIRTRGTFLKNQVLVLRNVDGTKKIKLFSSWLVNHETATAIKNEEFAMWIWKTKSRLGCLGDIFVILILNFDLQMHENFRELILFFGNSPAHSLFRNNIIYEFFIKNIPDFKNVHVKFLFTRFEVCASAYESDRN